MTKRRRWSSKRCITTTGTVVFFIGILIAQLRYISIHYQLMRWSSMTKTSDVTSLPLIGPQHPVNRSGGTNFTSIATTTPKYGFGACLMVKDDNDLLYEWIAYHYTVLSLRYLVIGSDVGSTQNVSSVLSRWNNVNLTSDGQLHYWILPPENFMYRYQQQTRASATLIDGMQRFSNEVNRSSVTTDTKQDHHHALIDRQKGFVTVCSEMLKTTGVAWTLYIDSDEFVVWNPMSDEEDQQLNTNIQQRNAMSHRSYAIRKQFTESSTQQSKLNQSMSYYDRIQQLQDQNDVSECYTMPRLLVGALENRTCPDRYGVKKVQQQARRQFGHRFMHMSTLRYFQHAKKGDFSRSKYGKVMMDLTKIDVATIRTKPPRNIHRPYTQHCMAAGGVYFPNAYFFILHYIGSWERYISRGTNDQRRNRNEWEERAYVDDGTLSACDSTVHHWIVQFVQLVGEDRTKYLLGVT